MVDCFVGRQPIFDRYNHVFAYELLYRSSLANEIGEVNRTVATSRVIINAFVDIGLENIVGNHRAVLNVTDSFLHDPELACFPPDQVVLALPNTTAATDENRAALDRLKTGGFTVALNGYRKTLPVAGLLPYADIVSFDTLHVDNDTLSQELATVQGADLITVAKRVETTQRRNELAELGFDCFQGHFLARPEIITGKRLSTNRTAVLQLVAKVNDPNTSGEELETLIAMDPALSLRVLRFVNSPLSGLSHEIESIHHAIVLLGRDVIKNWVMLLAISSLDNSIPELITTAFVRAKFCERLAVEADLSGKDSYFTVGLFSLMGAMLATPMDNLVETLPFTTEIKSALTDQTGTHGEAIRCAQQLEHGVFKECRFQSVPSQRIADLHLNSTTWAEKTTANVT